MTKQETNEAYSPNWVRVTLMINPETKEIRAIGGDREPGGKDMPCIGLELILEMIRDGQENRKP